MDRHDSLRPRRDGRLDELWVHQHLIVEHVDKDRRRTGHRDPFGSRDEGVGHRDDFITRADSQRSQRQVERVSAIANSDTRLRFAVSCEFVLKTAHLGAAYERTVGDDVLNRRVDFRLDDLILVEQTDEWNLISHSLYCVRGFLALITRRLPRYLTGETPASFSSMLMKSRDDGERSLLKRSGWPISPPAK